jgi:hypothetical protein
MTYFITVEFALVLAIIFFAVLGLGGCIIFAGRYLNLRRAEGSREAAFLRDAKDV